MNLNVLLRITSLVNITTEHTPHDLYNSLEQCQNYDTATDQYHLSLRSATTNLPNQNSET